MPELPVLAVVAAVIEQDGKFLACRRRPEKVSGGLWEFPGGKVEPHESPSKALVREINEELGVDIEPLSELCTDDTAVNGQVIRLTCLLAQLRSAQPTHSTDHDQLMWVEAERLTQLPWAAPDLPAVGRLAARAARSSE